MLWGFQFKPLLARMEKGEKKKPLFFSGLLENQLFTLFFLFMPASFFHAPFSSLEKIMGFVFFFFSTERTFVVMSAVEQQ